ncbi:signal-regulatory protein beta-1-like [Pluvialis apricaria]
MTMVWATRALPLACLLLLLLRRAPGAGAQGGEGFELQQPQDKVSVTAGETLTLTCIISSGSPPGPVRWLKGLGSGNQTIYDQTVYIPGVSRASDGSNTNFTIHIRDVCPQDAGTYYCVKFKRSVLGDVVLRHGKGTEVSVHAKPTAPVVSGPGRRAGPGQSVPFTCTAGGFFPEDIRVKWLKDRTPISAQQTRVTPGRTKFSYNMSSTVTMTLEVDDVRSQLICEVQHATLTAPLRGTYRLSQALRGDVAVTWLENGREMKVENISRLKETRQGLFKLSSVVEIKALEEKNESVFTCCVVHDSQAPTDSAGAQGSEGFELQQPQDKVSVAVGKTLTLTCITSSRGPAGPVRWLKGLGSGNQTIYDQTVYIPGVSRASDGSNTNFTIHIRDVCPQDAGTYYCVKFKRSVLGDVVLRHGKGTEVSVHGASLLSSPGLWLGMLLEKGLLGGLLVFLFKRGRA